MGEGGPAHDRPRNGPAAEEEKKKVGGGRAAYIEKKGHSLLGALRPASTMFDCCSLGKHGWKGIGGRSGRLGAGETGWEC
jgi:hypothetical protein